MSAAADPYLGSPCGTVGDERAGDGAGQVSGSEHGDGAVVQQLLPGAVGRRGQEACGRSRGSARDARRAGGACRGMGVQRRRLGARRDVVRGVREGQEAGRPRQLLRPGSRCAAGHGPLSGGT